MHNSYSGKKIHQYQLIASGSRYWISTNVKVPVLVSELKMCSKIEKSIIAHWITDFLTDKWKLKNKPMKILKLKIIITENKNSLGELKNRLKIT